MIRPWSSSSTNTRNCPHEAHAYADSVARLGRAVAVKLIAATQRPSQDAMGKGRVRSQMDIRICLRVRERRDVDLILGPGAFKAGWHAHQLTQPGAFLISDPEHTAPERHRAYLIDDAQIARHAAHCARSRPGCRPAGRKRRQTAPGSPQTAETARPDGDGHDEAGNGAAGRAGGRGSGRGLRGRAARADRDDPPHATTGTAEHADAGRAVQVCTRLLARRPAIGRAVREPGRPDGPARHGGPDGIPAGTEPAARP